MVDWKKNNKIALRNFSENSDFHDVVKTLLVRMLRRKHPDSKRIPIYTEYNPEEPNENYPDIWMKLVKARNRKKGQNNTTQEIYVWELQDKITKEWTEQICEKHEQVNLIIVPLKKLSKNIVKLKEQLEDYII